MGSLAGDYRSILRREFDARIKANAKYSLRAFARDLKIAPSRLSEVLSGKQGLSRDKARGLARELKLSDKETEFFCDLVESQDARGRLTRDLARIRLRKHDIDQSFHSLGADSFQVVSDWYHFAILQLIGVKGFKNDPGWIAKALEITRSEAREALERLKRLGLIEEREGELKVLREYVSAGDGVPSSAIRKFHAQVLERAIGALETQTLEERYVSTVFIPIDRANLEAAGRWIRAFRRKFSNKVNALAGPDGANAVYCLSMQFFDVSPGQGKKGDRAK